jgi:hypothetical protein
MVMVRISIIIIIMTRARKYIPPPPHLIVPYLIILIIINGGTFTAEDTIFDKKTPQGNLPRKWQLRLIKSNSQRGI